MFLHNKLSLKEALSFPSFKVPVALPRFTLGPIQGFKKGSNSKQLQDDPKVITMQLGNSVWSEVPSNMRSELWRSLLGRKGQGPTACAQYQEYLAKVKPAPTRMLLHAVKRPRHHAVRFASGLTVH
jgi:hypothetical protein